MIATASDRENIEAMRSINMSSIEEIQSLIIRNMILKKKQRESKRETCKNPIEIRNPQDCSKVVQYRFDFGKSGRQSLGSEVWFHVFPSMLLSIRARWITKFKVTRYRTGNGAGRSLFARTNSCRQCSDRVTFQSRGIFLLSLGEPRYQGRTFIMRTIYLPRAVTSIASTRAIRSRQARKLEKPKD